MKTNKLTSSEFETLLLLLNKLSNTCDNLSTSEFETSFEDDYLDKDELVGSIESVMSIIYRLR